MHDLVIRGGFVVDGTGAPGRMADIAIDGDRITAVGKVTAEGRREIDASGLLVTPGWVDMHTHYDGQATWDPYLTPSGWHGCTTVVMGNCGVGFAPVRTEDRDWLIVTMEGVEDIPGSALSEGIQWSWETFPEYLDTLDDKPFAIDVGTQVPHSAVRGWVMGRERAEAEDPATPDDIAKMREVVAEGLRAGALGFSTSRTSLHKTSDGDYVAGTFAAREELLGIGEALGEVGHGVFEIADEHGRVPDSVHDWMIDLAKNTGRPVVFNLTQIDADPTLWKKDLELVEKAQAEGVPLFAQVAGRAIGIMMNWRGTAHPFALTNEWVSTSMDPWETRLEKLKDPAFRQSLIDAEPVPVGEFETFITRTWDKMFLLGPDNDYEPDASESLGAKARRLGVNPAELAYDAMMENEGTGFLYFPLFNYSDVGLEHLRELHSHPHTRMGLSDGGAHCGAICDSGMPTFMITHWTRDRSRGETLPLEHVVKRQTSETAAFYGLEDRGVLAPGYLADVNVIDYDNLTLRSPEMVWDLPAEGRRLVQRAEGYRFTIKSGEVIFEDGEPTGALPGGLIRGPQAAPATAEASRAQAS